MNAPVDRNLLFGLLALQTGMIDQVALVAAFHAWTRDKCRSMAEILRGQGAIDSADVSALQALAVQHIKRFGDDVEKSLAAVPSLGPIAAGLAALGDADLDATLGHVQSGSPPTQSDRPGDASTTITMGGLAGDGQRFRLLRPHARGGLGEVFVALDAELNREVALKRILDHHADDPNSRARFVLEAEITGGLEHPGIVPVYGLGSIGGGRPYYAMRLIRGDNLKDAIAAFHADPTMKSDPSRRSLALRTLLRRFTDVCNAIEYAHTRGVIHRDIKPANVIVGKHGETLVIDWGLAKAIGRSEPGSTLDERTLMPSSASGSSETLPGSAMGTPAYMSPEQAVGDLDRIGPRSDVYSLGATLYCLLTGKPPLEGNDLGAMLRAVSKGEIPTPRSVDPQIDRAIEAVCRKAMAIEPKNRYATPRALADDIERWMADEPVSAWKEPMTRSLARWLSRHRTGVTAASAAVLAGVIGLSAVLAVESASNARLAASLKRETAANDELTRSKAAVQARYDLAFEAIKTFHTGVSEDFLLKEDKFKDLRDRLLKSASDFYGKLGALLGKEADFASRQALARSNFELAELTFKVGRLEAALAEHRAVLAAREALAAEPGADVAAKADVGRSLTEIAFLLEAGGKFDEALAAYRQSESLLAPLAGADPSARSALADCRSRMGVLLFRTNKKDEALTAYRLARADQETLADAPGASADARLALADTVGRIAFLLHYYGEPAEAEFRRALAIRRKLSDENPDVIKFRVGLAVGHRGLGLVLPYTDKLEESEAELRRALAIYQGLADANPAVADFREALALSHHYLAWILPEIGKLSESEAKFRRAEAIQRELVDEEPSLASRRDLLAMIQSFRGLVLMQLGRLGEAESECRSGLANMRKAVDENPSSLIIRNHLPWVVAHLGDVLRSRGLADEASGLYERMIGLTEPTVRENPGDPEYLVKFVMAVWRRGLTRRDLGDIEGAADDVRRAVRLSEGVPPQMIRYLFEKACSHAALAGLAGRPGSGVSVAEGEAAALKAMGWLRRAVDVGYRNANEVRTESALDPLRSRADFRLLMMDMAMPADPFAK